MGQDAWTGVTIGLQGLSRPAIRRLERRVSGFQQARRQHCLTRLQPHLRDDRLIRHLARDPRLADDARHWADWLLADSDVRQWYCQTLELMPPQGIWQRERAFFLPLRTVPSLPDTVNPASLWQWHPRHGLDLSVWLGREADQVELAVPADARAWLGAHQQLWGQWLYWRGQWVIHLFVPPPTRSTGPLPYVAAALLVPPLAGAPMTDYHVQQGDTLWGIAAKTLGQGRQWHELYTLNHAHIAHPHWIYPGQRLIVPGKTVASRPASVTATSGTWVVRPGDTLWRIAAAQTGSGAQWPALWQANRTLISRPDQLPIGLRLRWPAAWALPMAQGTPNRASVVAKSAPPSLQQTLRQQPLGRTTYPQAPALPPLRTLLPAAPARPAQPTHEPSEAISPNGAADTSVQTPGEVSTSPVTVEPGPHTALPLAPVTPFPTPAEAPVPTASTLPAEPVQSPILVPAAPLTTPPPPAAGSPALPTEPIAAPNTHAQPVTPLNRVAPPMPLPSSAPPSGDPQDGAWVPASVSVAEPVAMGSPVPPVLPLDSGVASDAVTLPVARPELMAIEGADGVEPAPLAALPSPPPSETEPIMPASGGTDPWGHWLRPGQSPPERNVAFSTPIVGPRTLWPRFGYQAVPEYLSETANDQAQASGWAVNRQRLDAEWGWGDWLLRGKWTFGRYELARQSQTVSRQESWVDVEIGQQWRPVAGLQLSLLGRGTWWSRRGAGPGQLGLLAADLQGFGLGPVGALSWNVLPNQSLIVEAAAQPLIPVSFSGAVQAAGQVGQLEGYVGWRGQWGMWRPHLGYRGRWLYDADGTYSQFAHGLALGLSVGWGGSAISEPMEDRH